MEQRIALITGVTGQDGSYLAELLLSKGYEVHGIMRRSSSFSTDRINHLYSNPKFLTHYGDLTDCPSLYRILDTIKPDEIYNLGAMSQVKISFEIPQYTFEANTIGLLNLLEWIRNYSPKTKIYQASSSEMFGRPEVEPPFNEDTPMKPQSPYGIAKLASYHLIRTYATGYGIFATTGILFNHESPRRGHNFVSKKIAMGVAKIKRGEIDHLELGNLNAKRDWGWSPEFVEAIYLIMQQPEPGIWVVATQETHTVEDFAREAFRRVGLDYKDYVVYNGSYERPNEVPVLLGDASKISKLGWTAKHKFIDIVNEMVDYELND